jgi:hypothetical protein
MLLVALSLGATPCTPTANGYLPCQYTCGSVTYDLTPLKQQLRIQDSSDPTAYYCLASAIGPAILGGR